MSETTNLLTGAAGRIFLDLCSRRCFEDSEKGIWPQELWTALSDTGLVAAAVNEERGGAGAEMLDLYSLARTVGYYAAPVPLIETWIAEMMLESSNLPPIEGPLAFGPVLRQDHLRLERKGAGWELTGQLKRIPWARNAVAIIVIAESNEGSRTVVIRAPKNITESKNYAHEPRDELRFDKLFVPEADVSELNRGFTRSELFFKGALFRTQEMAGAMERVLEFTVSYAKDRIQFGRPIGKFQAVQQQIAALASQAAAGSAVAQSAAESNASKLSRFEIAAAKARVGEAVSVVAGVAHQVHAAIGFTHEHPLHRNTRRLWAWRDEFGTEAEWAAWVGSVASQIGGEKLWAFVVAADKRDIGAALP
jgi:acyl-CoA dehydrogenase